jgi:hypothetical protein
MAQMKKPSVSGKTVKTTTYSLLKPSKKDVKMVNERTTRKPAAKRPGNAKPVPLGTAPAKPKGRKTPMPATATKSPADSRFPSRKPAPLTSSEKAFLEGQKKKAQITKKTGVYPNTAN